ncbi:hypothetical protein ACWGJX_30975 [Streptomyces sp. NPDC054775]
MTWLVLRERRSRDHGRCGRIARTTSSYGKARLLPVRPDSLFAVDLAVLPIPGSVPDPPKPRRRRSPPR